MWKQVCAKFPRPPERRPAQDEPLQCPLSLLRVPRFIRINRRSCHSFWPGRMAAGTPPETMRMRARSLTAQGSANPHMREALLAAPPKHLPTRRSPARVSDQRPRCGDPGSVLAFAPSLRGPSGQQFAEADPADSFVHCKSPLPAQTGPARDCTASHASLSRSPTRLVLRRPVSIVGPRHGGSSAGHCRGTPAGAAAAGDRDPAAGRASAARPRSRTGTKFRARRTPESPRVAALAPPQATPRRRPAAGSHRARVRLRSSPSSG